MEPRNSLPRFKCHGRIWRRELSPWLRACVVFERGFIGAFVGPTSALFRDDPSELGELAVLTKLRLRSDYSGKKYVGAWARHVREAQLPGYGEGLKLLRELLRVAPLLQTVRLHHGIASWNIEELVELTRAYPMELLELREHLLSEVDVSQLNSLRVGRLILGGRSRLTPEGREALLLRYREHITFET